MLPAGFATVQRGRRHRGMVDRQTNRSHITGIVRWMTLCIVGLGRIQGTQNELNCTELGPNLFLKLLRKTSFPKKVCRF